MSMRVKSLNFLKKGASAIGCDQLIFAIFGTRVQAKCSTMQSGQEAEAQLLN